MRQVEALPDGEFDPRVWWVPGTWKVESRGDALARSPEFGRRFIVEASERLPAFQDTAVFLRWSTQPDDIYAVISPDGEGIGIQIDVDLEYVIVWGRHESAEFGDWNGDQVRPAIEFMTELLPGP